jgi:aspartate-semialdehyde dehydrogenase
MKRHFRVAILGATGAVGREMLRVLEERNFPVKQLTLLASPHREGSKLEFRGNELAVQTVAAEHFQGVELAFFSLGAQISKQWAPIATKAGVIVIDNSSALRMDSSIPLVVPEVNPDALELTRRCKIVANPNCSTIQMATVLKPLHSAAGITRIVVSTYQSVSGKGQQGVKELEQQTSDLMNAREIRTKTFVHRIAFNVVPHIDQFADNGYTRQELKLVNETKKILNEPNMRVSATAVRVPVFFGHSQAINISTERKLSAKEAREILRHAPGVKVLDDPKNNIYPMPMLAAGDSYAHVGRIREDISQENGLELFVCADNLRKGAALNAVQIAECLVARGMV